MHVHGSVCEHVFISKGVDVNTHCTSMVVYVSVTNTYCVYGKLGVPLDLECYLARLLCWPQWPCQLFQWPRNAHQYNRGRNRRQQFPRGGKDSLPGPFDLCHPRFLFQSKRSEFCYWLIRSEMRETFKMIDLTFIQPSILHRDFSYLFSDLIVTTTLSSRSGNVIVPISLIMKLTMKLGEGQGKTEVAQKHGSGRKRLDLRKKDKDFVMIK